MKCHFAKSIILGLGLIPLSAYAVEWYEILNVKPDASPNEILQVSKDAKEQDIQKSFQNLQHKFNPQTLNPENRLGPCKPVNISKEEAQAVVNAIRKAKEDLTANKSIESHASTNIHDYHFNFNESDIHFRMLLEDSELKRVPEKDRVAFLYAKAALVFNDLEALKFALAKGFDPNTSHSFLDGRYFENCVRHYHKGASTALFEIILPKINPDDHESAMSLAIEKDALKLVQLLYKHRFSIDHITYQDGSHHVRESLNAGELAKKFGHKDILDWYNTIKHKKEL